MNIYKLYFKYLNDVVELNPATTTLIDVKKCIF